MRKARLLFLMLAAPAWAAPASVAFDAASRTYSLVFNGAAPWRGISTAVKLDGKWLRLSDFAACEWHPAPSGGAIVCRGAAPLRHLSLTFGRTGGAVTLRASAVADRACGIQGFRLLDAPAGPPLESPAPEWMLYGDGFNALEIGTVVRLDRINAPIAPAWISVLHNPRRRLTFGLAALSCRVWPTWFEWGPGAKVSVRAGGAAAVETVRLEAGAGIASDPVEVGFWNGAAGPAVLEQLADEIARANPRPHAARRPDPGWCSWMCYAGKVNEQDVLRAADAMRDRLAVSGYRMVQIDGGWWDKRGDWRPNSGFPHGMKWLSAEVHRRGLLFGIHMSPFRIDAGSELARNHKDWMLRTPDGSGLVAEKGREPKYVLDTSNPAALAWLRGLFAAMAREWNLDYFKLDFLSMGASEGSRHDRSMTGVQALAAAARAIREAVPPQVLILGCNLPSLDGYEYFDAVRVGPDINKVGRAHSGPNGEFASMVWGPPLGFVKGPGGDAQSLAAQARAVARQFYTHGRLFVNDADAVLLTPGWSLEEARAHFTLAALTGGSLFLGDRLDTLPPDRLALATNPAVLSVWREGRHAVPVDLFSGDELPRIWRAERLGGAIVTAVFNWLDAEQESAITAGDLGLDPGLRYSLRDLWSGASVEIENGKLMLRQPPHSVRLIEAKR
ncbi:MAG: alpha-galactosidase [Acidobacteria bacterium]|nr:alpha-galactosidase [Acidobacteriota bacterium]